MSTATIAPRKPNDKQRRWRPLQDDNRARRRADAATVVRGMFPTPPAGPARYAVSRARNGSEDNPVLRLTDWFVELRNAGGTREQAEAAVLYQSTLIAALWDEDGDTLEAAVLAEQEADAAEDVVELFILSDRSRIPEWIARAERAVLALTHAIAVARRTYMEGA